MTTDIHPFYRAMNGTDQKDPWCMALFGIIGKKVTCSIYERRSSACREFEPSWQNGVPNERCDAARIRWGLAPLVPESWRGPGDMPKAA